MSELPLASGTEAANARLDRLERESFRRKWDSTVLSTGHGVPRDAVVPVPTPGPSNLVHGVFVDLLTERLDRLESKTSRLERDLARLSRRQRIGKRVSGTLLFAAALAVALTLAQVWARGPGRTHGGPWSSLASLTGWGP